MKKLTIALLLFTLAALTSWAGDYQKGVSAYKSGDYATAFKEFAALAEQGNARAQTILGGMYDDGRGVPEDFKQAMKWTTKAAEQGDMYAQYILGNMHGRLRFVIGYDYQRQDNQQAAKWYTKAAEQGYAKAQKS